MLDREKAVSPIDLLTIKRPARISMQFRTIHLLLLMTAVAIPTSILFPVVFRYFQTPYERFQSDLAVVGFAPPQMLNGATFEDKQDKRLFLYFTVAYVKDSQHMLRHAYLDPHEPWYVKNWHRMTPKFLEQLGHTRMIELHDLLLDHPPNAGDLAGFIEPLDEIINEPKRARYQAGR